MSLLEQTNKQTETNLGEDYNANCIGISFTLKSNLPKKKHCTRSNVNFNGFYLNFKW